MLWKGRLRVLEIGSRCEIRLEVSEGTEPCCENKTDVKLQDATTGK